MGSRDTATGASTGTAPGAAAPPQGAAGASPAPTIKGIFVNSHVGTLRRAYGPRAVKALEARFGAPVDFRNFEDVPVREEVRLIEHVLDLVADPPVPPARRAFEAGRLHFRNFTTTPWARMVFALFPIRNFKYHLLHASSIAERVFKGVRFTAHDLGPSAVRIVMENNDYPMDHFKGLFHEWMLHAGLAGSVVAQRTGPNRFEYIIQWEAP